MNSSTMKYRPFPLRMLRLLRRHHGDAAAGPVCGECSSLCCMQGGFAILENVLLIYRRYRDGLLVRDDYEFRPGMTLRDFVAMYFDIPPTVSANSTPTFLHCRTLADDNSLMAQTEFGSEIPPLRGGTREMDRVISRGCVFLNRKLPADGKDDGDTSRKCILHDPQSTSHLTAKPIRCVLHTCDSPGELRHPDARFLAEWVDAIKQCYPRSAARLRRLLRQEMPAGDEVPLMAAGAGK